MLSVLIPVGLRAKQSRETVALRRKVHSARTFAFAPARRPQRNHVREFVSKVQTEIFSASIFMPRGAIKLRAPLLLRALPVLRPGQHTMGSRFRRGTRKPVRESSQEVSCARGRAVRKSRFPRDTRQRDTGSVRRTLYPQALWLLLDSALVPIRFVIRATAASLQLPCRGHARRTSTIMWLWTRGRGAGRTCRFGYRSGKTATIRQADVRVSTRMLSYAFRFPAVRAFHRQHFHW